MFGFVVITVRWWNAKGLDRMRIVIMLMFIMLLTDVQSPKVGMMFRLTVIMIVGWLLNVPATCECISGTDLLGQFCVLPH